jgi:hypothetical protein
MTAIQIMIFLMIIFKKKKKNFPDQPVLFIFNTIF